MATVLPIDEEEGVKWTWSVLTVCMTDMSHGVYVEVKTRRQRKWVSLDDEVSLRYTEPKYTQGG